MLDASLLNASCRVPEATQSDCQQLLEAALATVADAVLATDSHHRIVYLNAAAEAMTGWSLTEAAGYSLQQVFRVFERGAERASDSRGAERVSDGPTDHVSDGHGTERVSDSHCAEYVSDIQTGSVGDYSLDAAVPSALMHGALINRRGVHVGIEYSATHWRDDADLVKGMVVVCRPRRQAAEVALEISNESLLANDDALFEEKERAQVTLNSIGDAVICTNFSGRVNYLNVVGEKMTGWTQADASGFAVDDVFRLVDCTTRELTACPTTQAIIENRRVSLDAKCVLSRRNAMEVAVEVSASPIHDRHGGVIGAVMVARDVTAARELSQKLARLALHDILTDLPNRALFGDRLRQAIEAARARGCYAALLYVDLDRFKPINDSLGHAIGDKLLQSVARRLLGCVRSSDTVSRQGGDEFVVLLADLAQIMDASDCAEKILRALESPYHIGDHELHLSASIGIAVFPDDAEEGDALLRCADLAMYQAKYHGRNNYKLFVAGAALEARA